jgi:hypothetical protein
MLFWVVMPCRHVGRYNVSEKHTVSVLRAEDGHSMSLHDVTFQQNTIISLTSVKSEVSNITTLLVEEDSKRKIRSTGSGC